MFLPNATPSSRSTGSAMPLMVMRLPNCSMTVSDWRYTAFMPASIHFLALATFSVRVASVVALGSFPGLGGDLCGTRLEVGRGGGQGGVGVGLEVGIAEDRPQRHAVDVGDLYALEVERA